MEILRLRSLLHIQVLRIEMIIRARVDQEAAVISGNRYHDGIRRFDILRYDKINRSAALLIDVAHHAPEGVIPDLRNQRDVRPQYVQSQTCVGHAAPRRCVDPADLSELSGTDHVLKGPSPVVFCRKCGSDIYGNIPCCNDSALSHCVPSLSHCVSKLHLAPRRNFTLAELISVRIIACHSLPVHEGRSA